MEAENRDLLIEGAKAFGIQLEERMLEAFDLYLKELLKWNQKINLTSIRSERGIALKHFLDSLSPHPHLPQAFSLLDIGAGAGFPGIPLKIVRSSLAVTLIDSVRKKVDFQRHAIRILDLKGIEAVHGRVQEKEIVQTMEGRFDAAISRAFSDLRTLLTLSYPFLKKGGTLLAMKGQVDNQELEGLIQAERMGYRMQNIFYFTLPQSTFKRSILLFEKQ